MNTYLIQYTTKDANGLKCGAKYVKAACMSGAVIKMQDALALLHRRGEIGEYSIITCCLVERKGVSK